MPMTPTSQMEARIWREHLPRVVRLQQHMPRDEDEARNIQLAHPLFPGYPPGFSLRPPHTYRKLKECAFLPTPLGVTSGKVWTMSLLGLSFFRLPFLLPCVPYHQVMGDISPSYLFLPISRGVVPASRFPSPSLPLVFVALVYSCISPFQALSPLYFYIQLVDRRSALVYT